MVHPRTTQSQEETRTTVTPLQENWTHCSCPSPQRSCQHMQNCTQQHHSRYYSEIVHSSSSNPRTLFSTTNKLTKPKDNITTTFTTDKCNSFLSSFHSKIELIYRQLASFSPAHAYPEPELNPLSSPSFPSFLPIFYLMPPNSSLPQNSPPANLTPCHPPSSKPVPPLSFHSPPAS